MTRSIGIALALMAGCTSAAEPMDCYNDETEPGIRYTSTKSEILRVSDADITEMFARMRAGDKQTVASAEPTAALRVSLGNELSASD